MASEWQTAFVVSHKIPWCALLTAVNNYNKSLEKLQDFFFKTETKTKCSRPNRDSIATLYSDRDSQCCCQDLFSGLETKTETWTK